LNYGLHADPEGIEKVVSFWLLVLGCGLLAEPGGIAEVLIYMGREEPQEL